MLGSKAPSKAGDSLLAKYYHEFLIENPTLFVGAFDREQMVGFCMGYMRPSRARARFEKKNAIKLSFKLLGMCFDKNSGVAERIKGKLKSMFSRKNNKASDSSEVQNKTDSEPADLLSTCVLPEYRGMGVSTELVAVFESSLRELGAREYTLSVLANNLRAINFYKKVGFEICSQNERDVTMIKQV